MKIYIVLILLVLISCEKKEDICECDTDNTFTLVFQNYNNIVKSIHINNNSYDVSNTYREVFIAKINDVIYASYLIDSIGEDTKTYKVLTTSYMLIKPNKCGTYNYFF